MEPKDIENPIAEADFRAQAKDDRIKSLEDAGNNLLQAMNQYSFFLDGYRAGSASISECNHANDELNKAQHVLFELLKH